VATAEPARARILTWNVWWRFGPAWADRQPGLLARLREAAPDLVALQECWGTEETSQAHEFAAELGLEAAFVAPALPPVPDPPVRADHVGVEVGIGLLSRWPIAAARAVVMPSRHRRPAPTAMIATVRHPGGPLHVVAACLEWVPAFGDDRAAQAQMLVDLARDPARDGPLPVVVFGDLNAAPGSPILRPLRDALVDAWLAGGGDPAATTRRSGHPHSPTDTPELADQRIDHIFFRAGQPGLQVSVPAVALVGDPVDGLDPSDHMGVMCELTWTA
jgi:endonuclease/exonuclease/phosphatase family metal-dependent hydrolase